MSNTFQSWQELFVYLKANKYKISKALLNSIIEPKNQALPPFILQNISENTITIAYLENIQSTKLWQTFPRIESLTHTLNISTYLPIINNPVITIKDFTSIKPIFYIDILQISPKKANTLLNSLSILPTFVKDSFTNLANTKLQLSHDFLNINFLGEIDIREILNSLCLDLGLKKIDPSFGDFNICNPSINIQVFGKRQSSYQITIPQLNPRYIISLFKDLVKITLPAVIQSQIESLNDVGLVLSNSGIYLNFANNFQLDLDKFFNLHSAVSYIDKGFNGIITGIFGKTRLIISAPKLGLFKSHQGVDLSFKGLLNSQDFELIFGNKMKLIHKIPKDIDFGRLTSEIPAINKLKLTNPELILTNFAHSFTHSKSGQINVSRGFNFIGDVDFRNFDANLGNFIHNKLGVGLVGVLISFDPAGFVNLRGNIQSNIKLISIDNFNATFSNLIIGLDIDLDLEPNFGLTGNLALQGYDPTQENEPTLFLSGQISLEPESLTASFHQKGEKPWYNPYGIVGTELRNIGFQGGGTYLPPYFDNFGFIGDLKWQKIDIQVAFLMDINDPEKLALLLTTNQPVSLVDLWRGPITSFFLKQTNSETNLVSKALDFLEKLVNLNIESIDGNGDGQLNPLIKFVPFPTIVAGQPVSEGLEINGKITAWGREAILILQGDKTFKNLDGSLKVPEIDLGFIKIGGTDDDSLDLAVKIMPTEQYLMGDAYVEIFDNEIANVEFQITPTKAIFKDFDLNLANLLSIDVDNLSIDLKSFVGSGSGTISILGNTLVGIIFDVTSNSVMLKNTKLSLLGFLTLDVPILTVNLGTLRAMGTANITAFNQSLGTGTLSFNTQNITINNVSLGLGNILKMNIPNLALDWKNKRVFGLGDATFLGKQFNSLGISLNASGFQTMSNFNFGILAFNGATVSLNKKSDGNINNFGSIAGNLKFLGYEFANIYAIFDSSKLTISSSFNFGGILILKGINNQKNATITIYTANNGISNYAMISGAFYVLHQELTSINTSNNSGTLKILGIRIINNPDRVKKIGGYGVS